MKTRPKLDKHLSRWIPRQRVGQGGTWAWALGRGSEMTKILDIVQKDIGPKDGRTDTATWI